MKKIFLLLYSTFCILHSAFPQGCPRNYNFEDSSTVGWVCKSGIYGLGPYPFPQTGVCPSFQDSFPVANNGNCLNPNGRNALLNTGVDRHVIVDRNYYGNSID